MIQGRIRVTRVPEDDGVEDKSQRHELVFLSFTIPLPKPTAVTVEDWPSEAVTPFLFVELNERPARRISHRRRQSIFSTFVSGSMPDDPGPGSLTGISVPLPTFHCSSGGRSLPGGPRRRTPGQKNRPKKSFDSTHPLTYSSTNSKYLCFVGLSGTARTQEEQGVVFIFEGLV